ncbi:DEAD/DEAH box helicase [Streptococcus iniae]|uniref:DEAD/DEAH box helicase n=1 Tax=Streptococcus iniae TaxID=1346 RepID=UPI0008DA1E1F|nr:DEAD/DEAH box helicase [Streptococcus iniae]OHX26135.1 DNA/RNA helicase [Streptococcus iniae]
MESLELYYGRIFTSKQLSEVEKGKAKKIDSMFKIGRHWYCQRCRMKIDLNNKLPSGKYYCRECLIFGRNESDDFLYFFDSLPFEAGTYLKWQGQLTQYQKAVSQQLLKHFKNNQRSLVHAVTGAGKTEMIYQLIAYVLEKGGWLCLACPRVDVCIELEKRISRDFSCSVTLMHAHSESYQRNPIIIATTHQLLKFYRAFDLIIIDEVDAFPFVNNKMLNQALENALAPSGKIVYLTATSTKKLDKDVKNGRCQGITLARRFHNNPLVLPEFQLVLSLSEKLKRHKLPRNIKKQLKQQRLSKHPLLIFFPIIEDGQLFQDLLTTHFPDEQIAFVSSESEERAELIESFRNKEISILISTTILERGVTFPGVDVFVILANHRLYNASSLIQIAGRVGRSIERPKGKLLFFHEGISVAMIKAKSEIIKMNKIAYG